VGASAPPDVVLAGLGDPAPAARAAAARAAPSVDADRAIEPLVAAAADEHGLVRTAACDGLEAIGEPAVAPLIAALDDPRRRTGALAALERLPLGDRAIDLRRFAERAVADAVERHRMGVALGGDGDDAGRLLADSLMTLADRDAALALRAAALLGRGAELRVALDSLSVTDPAQRANALEVIESVSDRDLVRPLLMMWEGNASPIDRRDALTRLTADPDEWIRSCTALVTASQGGTMTETMTTLSLMERVLFLRKVQLFGTLAPPDLEPIASIAREQAFAGGDTIAEQGEDGAEMHIIVRGEVSVTTGHGDGRRVVATRSSGDVVGEMSLLTNEPRIAGLVCDGPVRVLTIDRPRFEAILRERPETSLGVIRVLCDRLAEGEAHTAEGAGTTNAST
jgi:CRP/FNR family cyclic AMP-dependent transcriptional regulator